jgi:hypothetical protein
MKLLQVNSAPAGSGAAAAFHLFDVFTEMVVDRQFLALSDGLAAYIKDVTLADLSDDIGIATVINILGSTTADGAIESPVVIESEEIDQVILLVTATFGLFPADTFTGIFHHFAADRDIFEGIDAPPVNFGRPDFQSEASELRIDSRLLWRIGGGHCFFSRRRLSRLNRRSRDHSKHCSGIAHPAQENAAKGVHFDTENAVSCNP